MKKRRRLNPTDGLDAVSHISSDLVQYVVNFLPLDQIPPLRLVSRLWNRTIITPSQLWSPAIVELHSILSTRHFVRLAELTSAKRARAAGSRLQNILQKTILTDEEMRQIRDEKRKQLQSCKRWTSSFRDIVRRIVEENCSGQPGAFLTVPENPSVVMAEFGEKLVSCLSVTAFACEVIYAMTRLSGAVFRQSESVKCVQGATLDCVIEGEISGRRNEGLLFKFSGVFKYEVGHYPSPESVCREHYELSDYFKFEDNFDVLELQTGCSSPTEFFRKTGLSQEYVEDADGVFREAGFMFFKDSSLDWSFKKDKSSTSHLF